MPNGWTPDQIKQFQDYWDTEFAGDLARRRRAKFVPGDTAAKVVQSKELYTIGWPEGVESRDIWGVDSVQALLLALQAIGADIHTSSHHKEGRLSSETPGAGYGFPVPAGMRSSLTGDDPEFV